MKLSRKLRLLLTPFVATSFIGQTVAGPVLNSGKSSKKAVEEIIPETHPMYLGTITGGIKTNDAYTEGSFSIVAPLWSTLGVNANLSGGLLFLEPYISYGEGGVVGSSLGLGYRYLFNDQPLTALTEHDGHQAGFFEEGFYIGANMFVDMLHTRANNEFWQLGVGLEAGSRYLELKANYYIPLSDRQFAEAYTTRNQYESSSTRRSSRTVATSDPYATGNTIAQDALLTNYATTTTTTTTIERLFHRYEEGMEGWDAQVSVLLPWVDRYMDVKVIGGYYSFQNPMGNGLGSTGDVEGWKAGLEVRPVPAIILSGFWYEDKALTGSDWTVGVQMQIPFEAGNLGDGKGMWDRIADSFKPRRRHLIERMAEPVSRQNANIKMASAAEIERETVDTKVKQVTRVVSRTPKQVVLASDLLFVNNGDSIGNGIEEGGTPAEDGTAERPYDIIQEAADRASQLNFSTQRVWTVYTQGAQNYGGGTYFESVDVTGPTRFISSITPVVSGLNGAIFGTGDRPLVNGGFAVDHGTFDPTATASLFSIQGYEITGGYAGSLGPASGAGVFTRDVDQVLVDDNIVRGVSGSGVVIVNPSSTTAIVTNNEIRGSGEHGLVLRFNDSSKDGYAYVADNTIVNNDLNGIAVRVVNGATAAVDIVNNRIANNDRNGIRVRVDDQSEIAGVIAGNDIINNGNYGIVARTLNDSLFDVDIIDNRIIGNDEAGIRTFTRFGSEMSGDIALNTIRDNEEGIFNTITDGSEYSGNISNNRIVENNDEGIDIDASDFALYSGDITNNVINDSDADGIDIDIGPLALYTGSIEQNIIRNSGSSGIELDIEESAFVGGIRDNIVTGNDENGIEVEVGPFGLFAGGIRGNTVRDNGYDGINVSVEEGLFFGGIRDNIVTGNDEDGIDLEAGPWALFQGGIRNNIVRDNGDSGVEVTLDPISVFFGGIRDNTVTNNGDYGIYLDADLAAFFGGIRNNIVNSNEEDGIYVDLEEAIFFGGISSNIANGNDNHGIHVELGDSSEFNGGINDNTLRNNLGGGIYADIDDSEFNDGMSGNLLTGNIGNGIEIVANNEGVFNGSIASNDIRNSTGTSLLVSLQDESEFNGDISNNEIRNSGGNGIDITVDVSAFNGNIDTNLIANTSGTAILVDIQAGIVVFDALFNGSINNNTISVAAEGIDVNVSGGNVDADATFTGDIAGNNITDVTGTAIDVALTGGFFLGADATFTGSIRGNTIAGATNGVNVELTGGNVASVVSFTGSIADNILSDISGTGISVDVSAGVVFNTGASFIGGITNNTLTDIGGTAIVVDVNGGLLGSPALFTGGINENTLTNVGGDGIDLTVDAGNGGGNNATFSGGIGTNTLQNIDGSGITVDLLAGNGLLAVGSSANFDDGISNNILDDIGNIGIDLFARGGNNGISNGGSANFNDGIIANTITNVLNSGILSHAQGGNGANGASFLPNGGNANINGGISGNNGGEPISSTSANGTGAVNAGIGNAATVGSNP